jgi:flagellin-like protein
MDHGSKHPRTLTLAERTRRYRRSRAGVSPIIATILLVAITVVLAAVLYVLISGLTHGPGSTPIGAAFEIANPTAGKCWAAGVTNHICGATGNQIYNLTIEVSNSVTLGDVLFEVKTAAGSVYKNSLTAAFSVLQVGASTPVAYYSFAASAGLAMTKTFTISAGYSTSTPITTAMYVVIGTGTASSSWSPGQGNYVTVLGTNHYSGVSAGQTLP